jgi:hypothetical protein
MVHKSIAFWHKSSMIALIYVCRSEHTIEIISRVYNPPFTVSFIVLFQVEGIQPFVHSTKSSSRNRQQNE